MHRAATVYFVLYSPESKYCYKVDYRTDGFNLVEIIDILLSDAPGPMPYPVVTKLWYSLQLSQLPPEEEDNERQLHMKHTASAQATPDIGPEEVFNTMAGWMPGGKGGIRDFDASAYLLDGRILSSGGTYGKCRITYISRDSPFFNRRYAYHYAGELEAEKITGALGSIVGKHDFASFSRREEGKSTVREVYEAQIVLGDEVPGIRVKANAFAWMMMRMLSGSLLEVGSGKWLVGHFQEVLEARDNPLSGPALPPHGLFLERVYY